MPDERFRVCALVACLLCPTIGAEAQIEPTLTECTTAAPVVVPEALPDIRIGPGKQTRTLVTTGTDAYRPVATEVEGGYVLVGATVNGTNRDLLIARLDDETGEVLGGTVVGGSGDDVARAITLGPEGKIVIVGSTSSEDLANDQGPMGGYGGYDGFALTLDPDSFELIGASFLGSEADDSIDAVVADSSGSLILAGTSKGDVTPESDTHSLITLFPVDADVNQRYFVARQSTGELPQVTDVFEAPAVETLSAWLDCDGKTVVGVLPLAQSACGGWPDLEYTMSEYTEDYDLDHDWNNPPPGVGNPPGGWGFHALRWKFYSANGNNPPNPWTVDWTLAPFNTPIPKLGLSCGDHTDLNALENNVFLQNGQANNPGGSWLCGQHTEVQELALIAAFLSQRWGTATYTTLVDRDSGQHREYTSAIEKTTFEVICPGGPSTYNGETLDDLCDFTVNSVGQLQCSVSSAGVSGGSFFLSAKELEVSSWLPPNWYIRPSSRPTDWVFQHENWYLPGDYIFDPPEDDTEGAAVIQAAARYLLPRMVQETALRLDRLEGGKLLNSEVTWGYVRSTSLR